MSNDAFGDALDRFAQFFISPIFKESATDREMKAVDSEYHMDKQDDSGRDYRVTLNCCNEESLGNRFTQGNLETLKQ